MKFLKVAAKHSFSLLTALVVSINLLFWMPFIFLLALLKLVFGSFQFAMSAINWVTERIYKAAAAIDSLWMVRVVGVKLHIEGNLPDHPAPIIIANHQSWFDIPILHYVVCWRGPVLKFLIKRQLVWVPIVGWICYALNFPRLNRGGSAEARENDYAAIESASSTLTRERGALLIFAEGTRFTRRKHDLQKSPHQHLLSPKPGGLKIALATAPVDTPVVDITIDYSGGDTNFWRCLHGANKDIRVVFRNYRAEEITDARSWLDTRWREKDILLTR